MMTAEERRIDFYGDGDSRAYDHDELYIMKEYAKDYHETEVKKFHKPDVRRMLIAFAEWQKKYKDSSSVDMFNVEEYLKASNLR